jgi:hypothetical protein
MQNRFQIEAVANSMLVLGSANCPRNPSHVAGKYDSDLLSGV